MATTAPTVHPAPTNPFAGANLTPSSQLEPADLLWVESWDEPGAASAAPDAPGRRFAVRGAYVEEFWLPVLGPSSIVLLRHLDAALAAAPEGVTVDLPVTAAALGLGQRTGRNGPMVRTIQRCCAFGAARLTSAHQLVVRRHLPALSRRQVARLPEPLQARHAEMLRSGDQTPPDSPPATGVPGPVGDEVDALRRRCRTLAVSLLDLDGNTDQAERQLHRWHFHPAMAHESVHWALAHLAERRAATPDQQRQAS
jgi:hypothetical protein